MSRRGENIYKRKDGRWEGRIRKYDTLTQKGSYGKGKCYKQEIPNLVLCTFFYTNFL